MKDFEVHFSFSGAVGVQAEDEAEAMRLVQQISPEGLLGRVDPATLVVHAATEVEIGGSGN
ncbi:MAG: hypothetical protein HYY21_07480 [Candidatus Tectomicrobia bacterium]|nr:hypothetical protein [Candidatus Tectomicrobia bacterium]